MRRVFVVLILMLPCLAQSTAQGWTIGGTVTGDDGTPISGAIVTALLVPPYPSGRLRQVEWNTVSSMDSSFEFDQVINGNYRLCVQTPGTAWLNPCEWGVQAAPVSLTSSEPTATVTLVLHKGAVVLIRLNDPSRLLAQYEGKLPTAQVLIGTSNDGFVFRTAPIISADATGRTHQVVIPFGVTVNLVVASSFFQFANPTGMALAKTSASIPITVQPGQQPQVITLTVTGGSQP